MTRGPFEPYQHPSLADEYVNMRPHDDRGLYDKARANRSMDGLLPVSAEFQTEWLPEAAEMLESGEYAPEDLGDQLTRDENVVLQEFMAERGRRISLGETYTAGEASEHIRNVMANPKNLTVESQRAALNNALMGNSGKLITTDEYFGILRGGQPQDRGTSWLNNYPWGVEPENPEIGFAERAAHYGLNSENYDLAVVEGAFGKQLVSRRKPGTVTPGRVYSSPDKMPLSDLRVIADRKPEWLERDKRLKLNAGVAAVKNAVQLAKIGLTPGWVHRRRSAKAASAEAAVEPATAEPEVVTSDFDSDPGMNALMDLAERPPVYEMGSHGDDDMVVVHYSPTGDRMVTWRQRDQLLPNDIVPTAAEVAEMYRQDELAYAMPQTAPLVESAPVSSPGEAELAPDVRAADELDMLLAHYALQGGVEGEADVLGLPFGQPETVEQRRRATRRRRFALAAGAFILTTAAAGGPYFAFVRK